MQLTLDDAAMDYNDRRRRINIDRSYCTVVTANTRTHMIVSITP